MRADISTAACINEIGMLPAPCGVATRGDVARGHTAHG
jgi:hypothetical protein